MFKRKQPCDELQVLPVTTDGLDTFVKTIVNEFNLPDTDDTYDNIATMIMHMPASACRAPRRYFGESVLKSMANKVAYEKLSEFRKKRDAAAKEAELKQAETNLTVVPVDDKSIQNKSV